MTDFHVNAPVWAPGPSRGVSISDSSALQKNGVIFASAARAAATYTSDEIHNTHAKGVRVFIDVTNDGAAGTVTAEIQVKDPSSGLWERITGAVTTALTETGAPATLTVYPGITVAANIDISNHLGSAWRVVAVVGVNTTTFSVGADYLL